MSISNALLNMFMELPPNFVCIEQLLKDEQLSSACISETFCSFAEKCFNEYNYFIDEHSREPLDDEIHSTYIFPLCELLLNYGLDPNYVFGEKYSESNIMYEIYWIDKPYVAADTLRLLLEHGGDPYLEIEYKSIWLMSDHDLCFDITEGYAFEDCYKMKFDCRFHFWLVLYGFLEDERFKEHDLYTYNIVQTDNHHWDLKVKLKD